MTLHTTIPALDLPYGGHMTNVEVRVERYQGDAPAVVLDVDGERYTTLSVWLPESMDLTDGWFYVKTWSENEGLAEALISAGVLELDSTKRVRTGWVEAVAGRLLG